jgi:ribosome-associated translation inhibitor RaiA
MELSIRTIGFELSSTLQAMVERRIRFALARFGQSIERVACSISDVNGSRGGIDKQVRLKVKPSSGRLVVIEQTDATVLAAIELAVDRIARGVARELQRARERPQRREARS